MATLQVKFYRGPESRYIVTSGGIQGADVMYHTDYNGAIYYATDTKLVYVDGTRYGYDASASGGLQGAFVGVSYVAPTTTSNAKLQFTNLNGTTDEVELYKVTSSSNAIDVTYNSTTKAYEVGLNIASNDQVLTQDSSTGLKVNLSMSYDHNNKKLNLYGKKDGSNNDILIAEVDTTDFVRDGMIKNVSIVTQDDLGNSGRFLKIEWNADSGESNYPEHEGLDPSIGNDLTTYVDLADFFDVITSDSSAIAINDYVIRLVVKSSQYLSIDNGVSGDGLVFNDASIDSQFTDIKNVAVNGHTIGDSIDDSSLLILATEIPMGLLTNRDTISDTSLYATDSVELAIAKINKLLAGTSSDIQSELDTLESHLGMNANGTLPTMANTYWLKNDDDSDPSTLIDAAKNLDSHVHSIDVSIQSMDYTEEGEGDFTIAVSQENGQISASRGYVADQTLHGYTAQDNGSFSAASTVKTAIQSLDYATSWHIVTAGS